MSKHGNAEGCGCGRHEQEEQRPQHEGCGCGEHHQAQERAHACGCHGQGQRACECGQHHGMGMGFRRRFVTREERIAHLQAYLDALRLEAQGVEEHIEALKAKG